ncbi:RTX family hemolysin [Actinobacillus pleuropneumoniae]|uniref:RTX family hemolysin n=1 Tax=Actinobacillus pleuropneumoniae TaxID=715 RepID=UPI0001DF7C93|nr:RTX family hemolysin [Actinobacillus pleuropneumoniae]EFL78275.1 RTX-III toxin determinant A from serotype 8 [Actinobacillus pleuropneumoniae serovar 2 str. 4226]EFM87279.1 Hemolysin, plasmid [Actinobacillus pleuropneumoniae serovar 2 str. S1536]
MSTWSSMLADLKKRAEEAKRQAKKGYDVTKNGLQYGVSQAKLQALAAGKAVQKYGNKLVLVIPKEYDGSVGNGFFDLVKAAEELGIQVKYVNRNELEVAHKSLGTADQFLGLTERGLTLFAPQLDQFLQKHSKISNVVGSSTGDAVSKLAKSQTIISGIQSVLGTVLAGINLNEAIISGGSELELAEAGVSLASELVSNIAKGTTTIDAFTTQIQNFGKLVENAKGLGGVGRQLQNISGSALSKTGLGLDIISSLLSGVTASFALANKNASTSTKVAAGFELSNQVIGGITKAVSSYILAQRLAAGLSTTGPAAALIASSISLAISPLAFLRVADNFNRSKEIGEFAERFKKLGYDGDKLLSEFYHEAGTIDASITTISTALSAIAAGTAAASAGALVGAPITLLVTGITGLISGILEFSKQPMLDHVASKIGNKIDEWEKKYGKNYFENGYDARHKAFLEDSFSLLSSFNKQYETERAVLITQQRWDEYIGELAGITGKGDKLSSGKAYVDYFQEGKLLEKKPDDFSKVVFDPTKGEIDISNSQTSTLLKFVTPLLTPGTESRERTQTGKYEYITKLVVKGKDKWVVNGVKDKGAVYDYTNLIQHAHISSSVARGEEYREVRLVSHLGNGNDKVFLAAGSAEIHAGEGHDVVYYDKTDTGLLVIDGTKATEQGRYSVTRELSGATKILREVIKNQKSAVGKREETLEYRDYELTQSGNSNLKAHDELHLVEEIIGSNQRDEFKGSKFRDIFHGADGDDLLNGNDGDDILYGDKGNDELRGDNGNDQLYGGEGDDKLLGGNGNNYLSGGDGNDELQVLGNGFNVLRGGKGDDKLYGSSGSDLLDGGEGNDYLEGGDGSDFYVYRSTSGNHTIYDQGKASDSDKLYLSDLSFDNILVKRVNDNLEFRSNNNSNSGVLTIKDWFKGGNSYNHKIEQIVDKNGRKLTAGNLGNNFHDTQQASSLLKNVTQEQNESNLSSLKTELGKIITNAGNFGVAKQGNTGINTAALNNEVNKIISSANTFATSQLGGSGMGTLPSTNVNSMMLGNLARAA